MVKKIYNYKCEEICKDVEDTESMLNDYAKQGWKLVCSYARGNYLILEREVDK